MVYNRWGAKAQASPHPTDGILDLDPPSPDAFGLAVGAARLIRTVLTDLGMDSAVKTSGAKGLHVFVPIDAHAPMEDIAAATRAVAARAERLDPDLATTAVIRDERHRK